MFHFQWRKISQATAISDRVVGDLVVESGYAQGNNVGYNEHYYYEGSSFVQLSTNDKIFFQQYNANGSTWVYLKVLGSNDTPVTGPTPVNFAFKIGIRKIS